MSNNKTIEFKGTGIQCLGYSLLATMLSILIIPAAWGAVALYRWFCQNLEFSDKTTVSFEGEAKDIYGYFIINILLAFLPQFYRLTDDPAIVLFLILGLPILLLPISVAILLKITRWFFSSISINDYATRLSFNGNYGAFLGWMLLFSLSGYTIIGWAWVFVAMIRWVCRNIEWDQNRVEFNGSGWGVLWRSLFAGIASILIIPIPWVWLWVIKWGVRNITIINKNSEMNISPTETLPNYPKDNSNTPPPNTNAAKQNDEAKKQTIKKVMKNILKFIAILALLGILSIGGVAIFQHLEDIKYEKEILKQEYTELTYGEYGKVFNWNWHDKYNQIQINESKNILRKVNIGKKTVIYAYKNDDYTMNTAAVFIADCKANSEIVTSKTFSNGDSKKLTCNDKGNELSYSVLWPKQDYSLVHWQENLDGFIIDMNFFGWDFNELDRTITLEKGN